MARRIFWLMVITALVGCGGAGGISGTVAGVSLPVADSLFVVTKDAAGKFTSAFFVLADKPNLCTSLKANRQSKNATFISFSVTHLNDDLSVTPPSTGDYTIGAIKGSIASSQFVKYDATCINSIASGTSLAKSGLVHVGSYRAEAGGAASGTLDLTFGTDHVTGSFNAAFCDAQLGVSAPSCE